MKNDTNKTNWSLFPFEQLEEVAKVVDYGAKKYAPNDWQNVEKERYFSAAMRHLVEYHKGKKLDESGFTHLAHCVCSLLFLMWHERES